jgi:hypothetical protein
MSTKGYLMSFFQNQQEIFLLKIKLSNEKNCITAYDANTI